MNAKPLTICYFGIYDSEFSRNRIYRSGLKKLGAVIVECRDVSPGFRKYIKLWEKHRPLAGQYDVMIVGYPGHAVVPLARLISSKKVIFDALGTLYEAEVMSHHAGLLKAVKTRIIDWLAVKCAHVVLVESEPQKEYFIRKFGGKREKYKVVYTGADEETLEIHNSRKQTSAYGGLSKEEKMERAGANSEFTVLFRGSLTPEAGIEHILKAAAILQENYPQEHIQFRILGRGIQEKEVRKLLADLNLKNVEFDTERLPWPELVARMNECSVSLGQFSLNPRLARTIPHKAFESLALGIPYVTARAEGVGSLLLDGQHCLMVNPSDPADLVEKILELKRNPALAAHLAECGQRLYQEKCTPVALAREIISVI